MKNLPKKIYLQIGEDCDCEDWNEIYPSHEITWCPDKIDNNDIEYQLTNDWRSVEDELPDWKMIQHETHSEAITDRVLIRRKNGTREVAIIRKNNTPDWYNGHHSINFDEVTHWMPLPSEPIINEEDEGE